MNYANHLMQFIEEHKLPEDYLQTAERWYHPLATQIASLQPQSGPLLVAINGCQGSGKSTLSSYLQTVLTREFGKTVANLSLDDFYKTHEQRQTLSRTTHPLLATRGAPGTHDTQLLESTLQQLNATEGVSRIPRFDKGNDDRHPDSLWSQITLPVDIVILEGWCMGAQPSPLEELLLPCNSLEADEDSQGNWRNYVNTQLRQHYLDLFNRFHLWIMLKAPSFAQVSHWRLEQEHKLAASNPGKRVMSEADIERFIQHYQRLTENCLGKLPKKCHFLYELNEQRQPQKLSHPLNTNQKAQFLT